MLRKFLLHPTTHVGIQMFRYGLVVAIAGPIDVGGYIFFKSHLHIEVVLAATLSFTISMIVNYFLSVLWVFNAHSSRQKAADASLFAIIGFVGLGLTDLIIWLVADVSGVNYIVAKFVALAIVFFWSFGARRILFARPDIVKKLFDVRPSVLKKSE